MTDPAEDLSAGPASEAEPAIAEANRALIDEAKSRRALRSVGAGTALLVILCLIVSLFLSLGAILPHLNLVDAPVVGLVGIVVVALAVLAIALLRSTFASAEESKADGEKLPVPPSFELWKEIRETAKTVAETFRGK